MLDRQFFHDPRRWDSLAETAFGPCFRGYIPSAPMGPYRLEDLSIGVIVEPADIAVLQVGAMEELDCLKGDETR